MKNSVQKRIVLAFIMCFACSFLARAQDRMPREYTNPDEVVTFDRSTSFTRALDVINQFAQDYAGKIIIDRTNTDGNLGITIPPMHWRDALDLILKAKYLQLVEQENYFEIVRSQTSEAQQAQAGSRTLPDTALTTDSKEVRINAIFFEGNRRALQEVGVDWSTLTENVPSNVGSYVNQSGGGSGGSGGSGSGSGSGSGGSGGGSLPSSDGFSGPFVSVNSKGAQSVSQSVFNSLINFGDVFGSGIRVQALFSAFEADNLGEILASPSVKVLEGEEGRIQVGQDFSIKQRDFAGNVTDKFFSVGTILKVTPQIIEQEDTTFIHLDISAERSSAQPDPVSTIINKQQATTQALLLDNEATVIAGLYRTESSEVRRGVPILKDLPAWFFGLRYLFGYNSKDYQTRELVILIQASIEPSIPERMEKERMPDKLEILRNERDRMENEIQRYRKQTKENKIPTHGDNIEVEKAPDKPVQKHEAEPEKNLTESKKQDSVQNKQAENIGQERPMQEVKLDTSEEQDQPQTEQSTRADVSNSISKSDHSYAYYVVGGSFKNESNANAMKQELQDQGYDPEILVSVKDGFYMVAYRGFENQRSAVSFLQDIKQSKNPDAWIYDNF